MMYPSRRRLLQLSTGLALAPLFRTFVHAAGTTPPRRFFVGYYTPNGFSPRVYRAAIIPASRPNEPPAPPVRSETDFDLPEMYAPLAAHKTDLVFIDALANRCVKQEGVHETQPKTILTGAHCGSRDPNAAGISFDQHLAVHTGAADIFPSVAALVADEGKLPSWGPRRNRIAAEKDPLALYTRLFLNHTPERRALIQKKKSVLGVLKAEMADTRRLLGADERMKLESYFDSLSGVEKQLNRLATLQACATTPAAPFATPLTAEFLGRAANYPALGRAHIDLLVAAFACGLTRTAMLTLSFHQSVWTWLGLSKDQHLYAHEHDFPAMKKMYSWFAGEFAYLLTKLGETPNPEGGGSLLDSAVAMWFTDADENHEIGRLPWVLAGRAGGQLRTGRYLRYGPNLHTQNDLFVSLSKVLGAPVQKFGDADVCKGELPGLI